VSALPRLAHSSRPPFPRLIATDLDGTLIGDNYTVSRRTAKALSQASAAGALVVLVTGRPVRWLSVVYEQLDGQYPAICANGAVDYDPVTDTVHESRPLLPNLVTQLCTQLAVTIPGITFAVEIDGGRRMLYEPDYPVVWESEEAGAFATPLAELVTHPAVKLLVRSAGLTPDEFVVLVETVLDGRAEVTHSSFSGLVEISARYVDKGTGLAAFAERLGIEPAEVLAFGDMPNDVPMLRWAGYGVAVANAHPAAQAAADAYTLSNVEDGVAAYLDALLDTCP
jgi:Cof subfamily protein (haloacid dehalogenase superfamily)